MTLFALHSPAIFIMCISISFLSKSTVFTLPVILSLILRRKILIIYMIIKSILENGYSSAEITASIKNI